MSATTQPEWTTTRIREALHIHYPRTPTTIDTQRAADDLGVSRRTIQRWIDPTDHRIIPEHRIRRRIGPLLPDEQTLADEQHKLQGFRDGLGWIAHDRRRIPPVWHNRGWLTPHTLYLVERDDSPLTGTLLSTGSTWTYKEITTVAHVADKLEVPTRIHGEVIALEILTARRPWRVLPPNRKIRTTRWWLTTAPTTHLS